ncbi:hypothetical protein [Variovorax sp. HJSM1_2]|uniref:hypothetical protein n=1 Tax=Variovorax sp. HJSM1_2 TaxID=3366263 RepID=UPI003BEAE72E
MIDRDSTGALTPTGLYRCTGCRVTFDDLRTWWGHDGAALSALHTTDVSRSAS